MKYATLLLGAVLLLASCFAARAGFQCADGVTVEYMCAKTPGPNCRTDGLEIILKPPRRDVRIDLRLDAEKDEATLNGKACRRVAD